MAGRRQIRGGAAQRASERALLRRSAVSRESLRQVTREASDQARNAIYAIRVPDTSCAEKMQAMGRAAYFYGSADEGSTITGYAAFNKQDRDALKKEAERLETACELYR